MKIVINRADSDDAEWVRFDRQAIPVATGRLLVDTADLLRYPRYFQRTVLELGLNLEPEDRVSEIQGWLPRLRLVQLNFSSFADGRAFTQARLLRERYDYRGDIRANGEVLRDQLAFMRRCGINQFNLAQGEDMESALAAFDDISHSYQPAGSEIDQVRLPGA